MSFSASNGNPSAVRQRKVFCVLGLPRSGTTWLLDLLNRHPQSRCSNEILTRDPFLHGVPFHDLSEPQVSHHGFKILNWQNSWWLPALMNRPEVPVILLWRENPVRHLYSITAAGQSGIYHDKPLSQQLRDRCRHATRALFMREFRYVPFAIRSTFQMCVSAFLGQSQYRSMPLRIPASALDHHLKEVSCRIRLLRNALETRGGPWIEVRYEQLAGPSHCDTMLAILELLGLPPAAMDSSVRRLNGKPLRELLLNHDEIEEYCRNNAIPFE